MGIWRGVLDEECSLEGYEGVRGVGCVCCGGVECGGESYGGMGDYGGSGSEYGGRRGVGRVSSRVEYMGVVGGNGM